LVGFRSQGARKRQQWLGLPANSLGGVNRSVEDGATALLDEPLLGVLLGDALELADVGLLLAAAGNTVAGLAEHDVEVHTENTSSSVVLDAQVDVLVDTETEVA
jgi:hypothetical protein